VKKNKFIVIDGEIRIGKVSFHRDLLKTSDDRNLVRGGGEWSMSSKKKTLYVWGRSHQFGGFNPDTVVHAKLPAALAEYVVAVVGGKYAAELEMSK
jgi:hypothetical protein